MRTLFLLILSISISPLLPAQAPGKGTDKGAAKAKDEELPPFPDTK